MLKLTQLRIEVGDFRLFDINLDIREGEHFVILGSSGAGKTVLLETIAGRYRLKSGRIEMGGLNISDSLPEQRNIGFVYQNYELFPHMTVAQNIAFGLKNQGYKREERNSRTERMLESLSLGNVRNCYPRTLSGGEKQRTAIGRALILSPRLLLLDEPMSALDYVTKQSVKNTIRQVHKRFSTTVLHVTHDIEEALFFAHRIGVIKDNTMPIVFDTEEVGRMQKGDFYAYL
jgi:ABC-type sugar transport system ATPase subunit